jgi:hypothetical protein
MAGIAKAVPHHIRWNVRFPTQHSIEKSKVDSVRGHPGFMHPWLRRFRERAAMIQVIADPSGDRARLCILLQLEAGRELLATFSARLNRASPASWMGPGADGLLLASVGQ